MLRSCSTLRSIVPREKFRVPTVSVAVDAGLIINPDGVINQIEGGIVQAISMTLKEQVMFDDRQITSRD